MLLELQKETLVVEYNIFVIFVLLPGFVGGTSTIVMLSLAFFLAIASSLDCLSSMVFIGGGVCFCSTSMAPSSLLLTIASVIVLNISCT